jgi:IclR family acetate operon transcriptional repressor
MSKAEDSYSTAVERALSILEAIAQRGATMAHSEISRKLDIPKSSATYLLRALERCGYVQRERGTGGYRLGLKVLSLALGVEIAGDIRETALPVLERVVKRCELTAHLAVLDQSDAVYVEKVDSPGFVKMDTWIGKRMELHSTAVGKALVAFSSAKDVEALIKGRAMKKRTPRTIATHAGFLRELEKVRERGYAIDDEENSLGARCVAAPVVDGFGRVLAAVGLSGTTGQIDKASVRKTAEIAKEAAREIARRLAHSPATTRRRTH